MAKLNQITIGGKLYIEVNANPSLLTGLAAPVGSSAVWNNSGVGSYFFKTGTGDTAWEQVTVGSASIAEEVTARQDADLAEITARNAAIAVEATARAGADLAEVTARNAAIAVEATARADADLVEITARNAAIAVEVTARKDADLVEVTARDAAIAVEATARAGADLAEVTARNAAIAVEVTARADADLAEITARDAAINVEVTARQGAILGEITARNAAIAAEATLRFDADVGLQNSINGLINGMVWRDGCIAATSDADLNAAANGTALSALLPFGDDDAPAMVLGDFSDGQVLLSKNGSSSKLFQIYDDGGTLKVSAIVDEHPSGIIAVNDTFVVQNDLPASPHENETVAVYTYTGSDLVRVGTFAWNLATGINLNTFTAVSGVVATGDTIQAAIQKIVGNIAVEATARADADLAEVTARDAAINVEVTARQGAILGEITARNAAIAVEVTARADADLAEVTARNAAIAVEATARAGADLAEITARDAAIAADAWHLHLVGNANSSLELTASAVEHKYFSVMSANSVGLVSDVGGVQKAEVAIDKKDNLVATLMFFSQMTISGNVKVLSFKKTFTSVGTTVLLVQDEYTQEDSELIGSNLTIVVDQSGANTVIRATLSGLPAYTAETLSGMMSVEVLAG